MPLDPTSLVAQTPVIPVLTIERAADAVPLARALVAGGLRVIEVTLRTTAALDAIRAIASDRVLASPHRHRIRNNTVLPRAVATYVATAFFCAAILNPCETAPLL